MSRLHPSEKHDSILTYTHRYLPVRATYRSAMSRNSSWTKSDYTYGGTAMQLKLACGNLNQRLNSLMSEWVLGTEQHYMRNLATRFISFAGCMTRHCSNGTRLAQKKLVACAIFGPQSWSRNDHYCTAAGVLFNHPLIANALQNEKQCSFINEIGGLGGSVFLVSCFSQYFIRIWPCKRKMHSEKTTKQQNNKTHCYHVEAALWRAHEEAMIRKGKEHDGKKATQWIEEYQPAGTWNPEPTRQPWSIITSDCTIASEHTTLSRTVQLVQEERKRTHTKQQDDGKSQQ